jgi:hypothetical protein
MCPHTTIYASSYFSKCPHTAIPVASYYYICVLILLHVCALTAIYLCSGGVRSEYTELEMHIGALDCLHETGVYLSIYTYTRTYIHTYIRMRPYATSVCGLMLLVYEAISY